MDDEWSRSKICEIQGHFLIHGHFLTSLFHLLKLIPNVTDTLRHCWSGCSAKKKGMSAEWWKGDRTMALAFFFLAGQDGPGSFYTFKTFLLVRQFGTWTPPIHINSEYICLKVSFASAQSLFMGPWPEVDLFDDWRGGHVVKLRGWSLESTFKII